jgi:membrane protein DedA with SNARE-associated domain
MQTIYLVKKHRIDWMRKNAPQLIVATIATAVITILLVQILEDILIEGNTNTLAPLGAMANALFSLTKNITTTISSWSYAGVFTLMLLESSSIPIPSEIILPFAGYLVSKGQLNLWIAIASSTLAGVLGSFIDYYIGLKAADALVKHRILGRVFTKNQLEVAISWFGKYGSIVILFSRLIPGFRTIVSFPAGAVKMPLAKFAVYTTIGCLIWNSMLIYFGYFLGSRWTQVAGISHYLIIGAAGGLIILFSLYLFWRRKRSRMHILQNQGS